jgi:hypothetical protein
MLGTNAKRRKLFDSEPVRMSCVEPLTEPDVAVIFGLPTAKPLTSPEPLTDANVVSDELQVTEEVTLPVLPSL